MGTYVYRVTANRVKLSDGQEANIAIFAYKPIFEAFSDKENSRMHFASGCYASERLAAQGKLTGKVVLGTVEGGKVKPYKGAMPVYVTKQACFYNDLIGTDHIPLNHVDSYGG